MAKLCISCGLSLDESEFNKSANKKDGLDSRCKPCKKSAYRNKADKYRRSAASRYSENREFILTKKRSSYSLKKDLLNQERRLRRKESGGRESDLQRNRYKLLKSKALNALGDCCSRCGISDSSVLCIDHVRDDGNVERKSGVVNVTIFRKIIAGDKTPYQCLCFNCNLKKSIESYHRLDDISSRTKLCKTCQKIHGVEYFKNDIRNVDGKYYECKGCTRDRAVTLKRNAFSIFGRIACECGIDDIDMLSIDHINEDGYLGRPEGLGGALYLSIVRGVVDISRFQILCMNCNIKKHSSRKSSGFISQISHIGSQYATDRPGSYSKPPTRVDARSFEFCDLKLKIPDVNKCVEFLNSHHYAGFGRHGKLYLALMLENTMIALAKYASPIRIQAATSCGFSFDETLELDRFCIHPDYHKKNLASWFLSRSINYIRTHMKHVKHLISFADPEYGHVGTMYKASNWSHHSSPRSYLYVDGSGRRIHKKTVYNSAVSVGVTEKEYAERNGLIKSHTVSKIKYTFSL
jgi:hypothetical protein